MKRLFFLCLALLFYGCNVPETQKKQLGKNRELILPVQIGKVIYRDVIEEIRGIGNIKAEQRLILTAEARGKVIDIHFQEGEKVKAGQKLASIDSRDYLLEIKKLEADLAAANQEYEKTTHGLRPEEQEKLRALTRAAESALDLVIKERDRTQHLVKEKVASQSTLDIADDQVRQAKEFLSSNQAALNAALKSREEDIAQNDSDREAVTQQLERAKLAFSKTTLRAPFNGIILSKKIEKGAYVISGTPIAEMIGSSKLKAVIEIPQSYRKKLSKLTSIQFSFKDLGIYFTLKDQELKGVRVIPDSNIFSGNLSVQINLPTLDLSLFPGVTLEAVLQFETRKNVLHVPSVALVITDKGSVIYSVKNQKANLIPVKAFQEKNGFIEIKDFTNQLSEETKIILRGASAVFPDVKVLQVDIASKDESSKNTAGN